MTIGPGLRPFALALALGTAGGALFSYFHLPLAWMIGAMTATTVAAMAGVALHVPKPLRNAMIMILGVMLGSGFTPDILGRLGEWSLSLSALTVYLVLATTLGVQYLRRGARLDPPTAFFTATPGGLNEMVMVGTQMGGDSRTMALSHALRVMLVVLVIPFAFQALGLYDPARRGTLGPPLLSLAPLDVALLSACALGYPLAKLLRIPAAQIVGPMLLSAAIHLAGLTEGKPPGVLVAAAQVVIGASLGCRFTGLNIRRIGRDGLTALGLTGLMLLVTTAAAWMVDEATGLGLAALILAFAPGGLAEMTLVALALNIDVALVATHHMVRIILIVTLAPGLYLLWRKWRSRRGNI
ncbi:AbrB family transcriptional regulator [Azospirillum brasilense]|uniref:AbrB family transcriptional regulator n=1 Tax=Azospirillum brasilense TaxID=192 RepID=A0A4D8QY39_AZOBR|nr:AbrB family transcriptional regulator [Azospirillum brasilense]QCO14621.1 AbrB family transcriptional regulator [Azospirillum brasilense]